MSRSFDFILAGASLIVGILLLTGHGDFFMKGGNAQLRKAKYDETKMAKGLRRGFNPDRNCHLNCIPYYHNRCGKESDILWFL